MREEPGAGIQADSEREGLRSSGHDLAGKYRAALILYAVLAALSWFTLDGKILIRGQVVELRMVPLIIIGGLVLRTMLAMKAEKIRRAGEDGR